MVKGQKVIRLSDGKEGQVVEVDGDLARIEYWQGSVILYDWTLISEGGTWA